MKINQQFFSAFITITLMQGNSNIVNLEKNKSTPIKIITPQKLCTNATNANEVDDSSINNCNDKMKDVEKKNDKKNNKQKSNVKRGKVSHLLNY